jgi:Arc/MetJ-type ribon-helix-helix transcriptional regulator
MAPFERNHMENAMLIPTKIQLDKVHYDFIKLACKDLHYRSLSDYVRQAVEKKDEGRSKISPGEKAAGGHEDDRGSGI